MSNLAFAIVGARPEPYAIAPSLTLELHVAESSGVRVDAIALRAQVSIEPQRRRYADGEAEKLSDLFGPQRRFGETLRTMLWANVATTVLGFSGETSGELSLPCSYDFEVGAHKYLCALEDGEIPLVAFFSGTVFVHGEHGVTAEFVPWSCEARYRLPVAAYRKTMEAHFPNSAWIRVHRDTFDALDDARRAAGHPTWDRTLLSLLQTNGLVPSGPSGLAPSGVAEDGVTRGLGFTESVAFAASSQAARRGPSDKVRQTPSVPEKGVSGNGAAVKP